SFGEIEHWRRPQANAAHVAAAGSQAFDQRMFEHRRADAPVVADCHPLAASPAQQRAEAAPDRPCVVGAEGFADYPANVVFTQDGRMKVVAHLVSYGAGRSWGSWLSRRSRAAFASSTWSLLPPRSGWTIATRRLCAAMMSSREAAADTPRSLRARDSA